MARKSTADATQSVAIGDVSIATRRICVGEFREFVKRTGHRTDCERVDGGWVISANNYWVRKPEACWDNPYMPQEEHDPVVLVSWYDALTFANWKSTCEGLFPSYVIVNTGEHMTVELNPGARGYRLPTEAEWNQAARAGIIDVSSPNVPSKRKPDVEAGLPPGPWCSGGAVGRLYEWCWDSLDVDQPARQSDWKPGVKLVGICRVVGSIISEHGKFLDCRSSCAPLTAASTLGFRLVKAIAGRALRGDCKKLVT